MKTHTLSKQLRITFFCCLALFLGTQTLLAQPKNTPKNLQTGKIAGSVVDAKTGKMVIGANVLVVGTARGDATDLNGRFVIGELATGIYSIAVSYIGYAQKTVTGIEVNEGETTIINVALQPKTAELEALTVTATVASNSAAGLLTIQRRAIAMQDGISAQYLEKTGDSNVASAIKRVPGVTLVNDNEVFVRGLGTRYTNVQLNGAAVPSTSATKEKAPIDIIESGLVDHIVVKKTYTPSQPAEFAGGTVKITTREFPSEQHFGISYSTSIRSISAFDNTLTYNASETDFFGYDDGTRRLPGILGSQRLTEENEDRAVRGFGNTWSLKKTRKVIPSQEITLTYADQYNEEDMPVGLVSSFTYKYNRDLKSDQILRTARSYVAGADEFLLQSDYMSNVGVEQVKMGGMLNLFVKPSSVTKIGWKNLYSNSLNNSTHVIEGEYFNYLSSTRQTIYDFDRRALFSSALVFETFFSKFYNSRLALTANYSRAVRDRPDRRTTQYNRNRDGEFIIYFDDAGNSHYYSNQQDNNYTGKIDYEIEPASFLTVKTGVSAVFKNRDFDARRFEYRNFGRQFPDGLLDAPPAVALDPGLVVNDKLDLRETTTPRDSYTGKEHLYAGYISTIWRPVDKLTVEMGARVENSDMSVEIIRDNQVQQIASVENTDILPVTNITYRVAENINLRGAFSLTLARPNFREISNFRFQDFVGGQTIYGNPDLKQTQIQNYDLRLEYYPNPGELFAISGFYKRFDNPIALFYRFTEAIEVQYRNADEATLYGIEVVARKNITSNLQIVANASYIYSQAKVKQEDHFAVANPKRPMYGQSPYTVNFGLFYGIPGTTLDFSLNYYTFGERLIRVGKRAQNFDEYEQPFHSLNAGLSYKYGSATISAGVENILGDDIVFKQGDLNTFHYEPGRVYELGVSLSL